MSKEEIQNRKEETYRRILDASWDIAVAEGLDALSVRKVAAALHFAPNNLYNYFQNKNELLYQLKKDAYEWTLAVVFKDIPDFKSAHEMMNYVARKLMHIALQEPERYIVMTADQIMDSEEPLDHQINDSVAQMISRGIEAGEFRQIDPQMTATNVRMSIIGFVRWISAQKQLTKKQADDYLDNFLSILFSGLMN
ncbi:MAG: TetR/AcrR family transcriptional regulator [bacterium]|nr:TetR/AcrR family transcriptional regulator [bacterium]